MSNLIPIKLAEQAMAVRDDEIASLKAEVERLRKIAQDIYVTSDSSLSSDDKDFIFQWGEYKEGKPSV